MVDSQSHHAGRGHSGKVSRLRLHRQTMVVVAAACLVLIGGVVALTWKYSITQPDSDSYQAVFLDNGQVFFGKLAGVTGQYATLSRAYYSKEVNLPEDATAAQKAAAANNVSLVKAGDEVYGPENTMQIRADKILFWQNLRSDSKVVRAITSAE